MKSNLFSLTITLLFFSVFLNAQNIVYKEATVSRPAEFWKPIILLNGTNAQNGVSVYSTKAECNSTNVKIIKLINENPYAVIFSYQLSETSPAINVIVPASLSIEGKCNSIDENLKKLVITPTNDKNNEENKDTKQFLKSLITITKFEK